MAKAFNPHYATAAISGSAGIAITAMLPALYDNPFYLVLPTAWAAGKLLTVAYHEYRNARKAAPQDTISSVRKQRQIVRAAVEALPDMIYRYGIDGRWNTNDQDRRPFPGYKAKDKKRNRLSHPAKVHANHSFITHIGDDQRGITIWQDLLDQQSHATIEVRGEGQAPITEELTLQEAQLLCDRLRAKQIEMVASKLQCAADIEEISATIALCEEHNPDYRKPVRIADDIHLVRVEYGAALGATGKVWLISDEFGALRLSEKVYQMVRAEQREYLLLSAFTNVKAPKPRLPEIIGNPAAAQTVAMAQRLIATYPGMTDNNGTAIKPLIEEHLPRLIQRHSDAVRAATATHNYDPEQIGRAHV